MISRRLYTTLASIFALPALKNLPEPALDQKQTKLLRLKFGRNTQTEHFLILKYSLTKEVSRELKFVGNSWKVYPVKLDIPSDTYVSSTSFKIFNCSKKKFIMPDEISLGKYYNIEIYNSLGDMSYIFNNFFLFKAYGGLPN